MLPCYNTHRQVQRARPHRKKEWKEGGEELTGQRRPLTEGSSPLPLGMQRMWLPARFVVRCKPIDISSTTAVEENFGQPQSVNYNCNYRNRQREINKNWAFLRTNSIFCLLIFLLCVLSIYPLERISLCLEKLNHTSSSVTQPDRCTTDSTHVSTTLTTVAPYRHKKSGILVQICQIIH